jgi:hypothetical protein
MAVSDSAARFFLRKRLQCALDAVIRCDTFDLGDNGTTRADAHEQIRNIERDAKEQGIDLGELYTELAMELERVDDSGPARKERLEDDWR